LIDTPQPKVWRITARGSELLASLPERIDTKLLSSYPEFRAFRVKSVPTATGNVQPPLAPPSETLHHRSPNWERDELVLALDLYLRAGLIGPSHPDVVSLSKLLRELRPDEANQGARYRNPNGVAKKLANFAGIDPEYLGGGLPKGGRLDQVVWDEFKANRANLATEALRVRSAISPQEPAAIQASAASDDGDTATAHTRAQWQLARIGGRLGLDVWIPRSDRHKVFQGHRLGDLSIETLPSFGLGQAQGIVENIDVLWIDAGVVLCAFEVEHSTAVYSGILRMSDLVTVQPYTAIKLFIVAGSDRTEKVARELARPTFAKARPPLAQVCRFLTYESLERHLAFAEEHGPYLKLDWVDQIAPPVEAPSPR
jgi:hypothetical protein